MSIADMPVRNSRRSMATPVIAGMLSVVPRGATGFKESRAPNATHARGLWGGRCRKERPAEEGGGKTRIDWSQGGVVLPSAG